MIYTINDIYPSRAGDWVLTPEILDLSPKIHQHEIDRVDALPAALAGKADGGHTHVAVASLSGTTGSVTLATSGVAQLTVSGQTITISAPLNIAAPEIAPALDNTASIYPIYTMVGTYAQVAAARKGSGYSLTAITDDKELAASTAYMTRPVLRCFRYSNGTEKAVDKVVVGGVQVYPPPAAYRLRLQSSLDDGTSWLAVDGEQYPVPLVPTDATGLDITVTPYPPNGEWYLEADGFTLPTALAGVHTGTKTLNLVLPSVEVGLHLLMIYAKPRGWVTGQPHQTLMFYRRRYAESTLTPKYHFPLNGDMHEVYTGRLGVWQGTGSPEYSNTLNVRGMSLGPALAATISTSGIRFTDLPASLVNGATLSFFTYAANSAAAIEGYVGFIDTTPSGYNGSNGNHFGTRFSYGQPEVWGPNAAYGVKPGRPTANAWHHVVIRMLPPTMKPESTTKALIVMECWMDGVLATTRTSEVNATVFTNGDLTTPGKGSFFIAAATTACTSPWYVDEVKFFESALTQEEIQAEAALAGFTFSGTGGGGGSVVTPAALPYKPRTRVPPADKNALTFHGQLKVFPIDERHIAVGGYFHDFYQARLAAEYPVSLPNVEANYRNGLAPDYLHKFYYRYSIDELMADYEPMLRDRYDSDGHFQVDGADVTWQGAWMGNPGLFTVTDVLDGTKKYTSLRAEITHFAYLELQTAMTEGSTHTITDNDGNTATFTYGGTTPSQAIKVNQVGYAADSPSKLAYLGFWKGDAGAHIFNDPTGFTVVPTGTGTPYSGGTARKITLGDTTDTTCLTGEDIWELDFSGLTTPGEYRIYIAGVGYSWPFVIGPDAMGKLAYIYLRGMYHQRSGIAKGAPYTQWPIAKSQGTTWKAHFSPNDKAYGQFMTAAGVAYGGNQFTMIAQNETGEMYRDVYGGWWDAADWDRRDYHLECVRDLVTAYLLWPDKFTDNQFDLPESGDGIPDILSEALWGMEIWRKLQTDDGAIGCWVEAQQHPGQPDATKEMYHFCAADPTAENSLYYARNAANLARALKHVGSAKALRIADQYLDSAARAFYWGMNNLGEITAVVNGVTYTYSEPEYDPGNVGADSRRQRQAWAAICMYKATGDRNYLSYVTPDAWAAYMAHLKSTDNNIAERAMWDICDMDDFFPAYAAEMRAWIIKQANRFMAMQDAWAYKNINWPPTHGFVTFQSWGTCHPEHRGNLYIYAYLLTGEEKYRTYLQHAMDWACGCNAMGRTLTTGLGHVYPVRTLSKIDELHRTEQNIGDPVPGISQYTYTGAVGFGKTYIYSVEDAARSDCNFSGVNVELLPLRNRPPGLTRDAYLTQYFPMWRKTNSLQDVDVAKSEWTVSETMSGKVLMAAFFLPTGWTPPADWKTKAPIANERDIPGFIYLP
jgi:hypothetical protein